MRRIKNILSLFCLGVLLLALSGRTVHILFEEGHEHEFVCSEKSLHVHEKEHSCFICEFELQLADGWSGSQVSVPYEVIEKQAAKFKPVFVTARSKFNFTQRGPPAA